MTEQTCKKCGQPISNDEQICPHCGNPREKDNAQAEAFPKGESASTDKELSTISEDTQNIKKNERVSPIKSVFAVLLVVLTILAISYTTYNFVVFQEEKKAAEAESKDLAEKEVRMKHFADSLYRNFSSTDLKMIDAKGFVRTLEFIEKVSTDTLFHTWFLFSKQGKIVDAKSQISFFCTKMLVMNINRTKNERVDNIDARTSATKGNGENHKALPRYSYGYDANGRICKINYDDEYGRLVEIVGGYDIEFSEYINDKGYSKRNLFYTERNWSITHNATYREIKKDSFGNWIYKKGIDEETAYAEEYDAQESISDVEQIRHITYYDKNQIDFSNFLKK